MTLREFLNIVNYSDFNISKQNNGVLKTFCRITDFTPIDCLSDKLLNSQIKEVFVDENFVENENDLFVVEIEWEDK